MMLPIIAVFGPWRLKSVVIEFKLAYQGEEEVYLYCRIFYDAFYKSIADIPYVLMTAVLVVSVYGVVILYAAV